MPEENNIDSNQNIDPVTGKEFDFSGIEDESNIDPVTGKEFDFTGIEDVKKKEQAAVPSDVSDIQFPSVSTEEIQKDPIVPEQDVPQSDVQPEPAIDWMKDFGDPLELLDQHNLRQDKLDPLSPNYDPVSVQKEDEEIKKFQRQQELRNYSSTYLDKLQSGEHTQRDWIITKLGKEGGEVEAGSMMDFYLNYLKEFDPGKHSTLIKEIEGKDWLTGDWWEQEDEAEFLKEALEFKTESLVSEMNAELNGIGGTKRLVEYNKLVSDMNNLASQAEVLKQEIGVTEGAEKNQKIANYRNTYDLFNKRKARIKDFEGFEENLDRYTQLANEYNKTAEFAQDYMKKYPKVWEKIEAKEKINDEYKNKWYIKLQNQLITPVNRAVFDFAQNIASIPRMVAPFDAVNEWTEGTNRWIEGWADYIAPEPSKMNTPLIKQDEEGKYYLDGELFLPKTMRTLTDMVGLLYGADKFAKPLKVLGVSERAAGGAGLVGSSMAMFNKAYYDEAVAAGMSPTDASWFAMMGSGLQGLLENVNPQKYVFGNEYRRKLAQEYIRILAKGGTKTEALKKAAAFTGKEVLGENLQEFMQTLGDKAVQYGANKLTGKELFDIELTAPEVIETAILTTIVSGGVAAGSSMRIKSDAEVEARYIAANNKEDFIPAAKKMVEEGNLSEREGEKVVRDIENYSNIVENIPADMTDKQRAIIADIISEKKKLEEVMESEDVDDTFRERTKDQVAALSDKINEITDIGEKVQELNKEAVSEEVPEKPPVEPEVVSEVIEEPVPEEVVEEVPEEVSIADIAKHIPMSTRLKLDAAGFTFEDIGRMTEETAERITEEGLTPRKYDITEEGLIKSKPEALLFYSPNIKEDLTYEEATTELESPDQEAFRGIADQVDRSLRYETESVNAIGDWVDGAENSVISYMKGVTSLDDIKYAGAIKGKIGNQKSVLAFLPEKEGKSAIYTVEIPTDQANIEEIRDKLSENGIQFRTLAPIEGATRVIVFDKDLENRQNFANFSAVYGRQAEQINGSGEVFGGDTRDSARDTFTNYIKEYESKFPDRRLDGRRYRQILESGDLDTIRKATGEISRELRGEEIIPEEAPEPPPKPLEELLEEVSEVPEEIPLKKRMKDRNILKSDIDKNKGSDSPDDIDPVIGQAAFFFNTDIIDERMRDLYIRYFKQGGYLPSEVFKRKIEMAGSKSVEERNLRRVSERFKKDYKKAYKTVKESELNEVDKALKGEVPIEELPEQLHGVVGEMRDHIDYFSKILIDEGIVEGDLVSVIQDNLGVYMTRSYQVYDDPKWTQKIPSEVMNRAKAYIRDQYKEMNLSEEKIHGLINELLYKEDAPMSIIKGAKLGSKDLSIFKKRKDIAPEIRALLGEYTDPLLNYAKSVTKMYNLIENHRFLTDIKKTGLGEFLFEEPTSTHYAKISAEGTKGMKPLNGLYTTPEIKEAFEEFGGDAVSRNGMAASLFRWYMTANGYVKYTKTVLSIMTHIRNLFGNIGFVLMNGHLRAGKFVDAAKTTINDLAKLDKKELTEKYNKYLRLGIVQESSKAGELQDIIKDATGNNLQFEQMMDNKMGRLIKKGREVVVDLYGAEDDVFKIYGFENELARYKKAYPEMEESELERMVADIIRNTYPTYSLVPRIVKEFRKAPLVGTFVSFPAEVIRTSYNAVELAIKEIKTPETRKIGIQRLSGILLASSLTGVMAAISKSISGVDDEEEKAVRRFLPEWSKNSQLLFRESTKRGIYNYVDLGYSDPHNYLKKPVVAVMKGEDLFESGKDALFEFFEPFLGEEILASRIMDVARNKKKRGGEVYNEAASAADKLSKIYEHLAEAIEPGTVRSFRRIWQGVHGKVSETGRTYDPKVELLATFSGQRAESLDIEQSFAFKANRFSNEIRDAKQIYTKILYSKGDVTEEELESARKEANIAMERIFTEMHKNYKAAVILGVRPSKLMNILKESRVSEENSAFIRIGRKLTVRKERRRKRR